MRLHERTTPPSCAKLLILNEKFITFDTTFIVLNAKSITFNTTFIVFNANFIMLNVRSIILNANLRPLLHEIRPIEYRKFDHFIRISQ